MKPINANLLLRIGSILLAVFIGGLLVRQALPTNLTAWDFRNNLWGPAHLLVTGRSPYLIEQLFTGSNSVWLPPIIGALFPLGWLSERDATLLWLGASLGCILLLQRITVHGWGLAVPTTLSRSPLPAFWQTLILLLMGYLFQPTISHTVLGQFSIFAMLLLLLATSLVERQRWWWAGSCVILALAKPQLALLPLVGLAFLAYRQARLAGIVKFVTSAGIWALLSLIPLFIGFPNWLEGMMIALERNPTWAQPSPFIVLRLVFSGDIGFMLWLMIVALTLAATVWLWRTRPPHEAMSWSLALTLLMTPYMWSWDIVLMLPLLFQTAVTLRTRVAVAVLIAGYSIVWVGMLYIRVGTDGSDIRYWWVTWTLLAVILLVTWLDARLRNTR